jgi:putative multiple sugar transport system substrate-binding protein
MTVQVLKGTDVDVNDTKTYNNQVKVVPAFLVDVVSVTKDSVQTELINPGYYTADQLK